MLGIRNKKGEHVLVDVLGPKGYRTAARRYFTYPFVTMLVIVISASIPLSAVLWTFSGSVQPVATFFGVELIRTYFPIYWMDISYVASRNQGPWDIFYGSILVINGVGLAFTTVIFAFLAISRPVHLRKGARKVSDEVRVRIQLAFGALCLIALIILGLLYVMLISRNPTNYGNLSRPVEMLPLLDNFLIMFLPSFISYAIFTLKVVFAVGPVRSRSFG